MRVKSHHSLLPWRCKVLLSGSQTRERETPSSSLEGITSAQQSQTIGGMNSPCTAILPEPGYVTAPLPACSRSGLKHQLLSFALLRQVLDPRELVDEHRSLISSTIQASPVLLR